jgi:EAL domain-containing protein (putative c-di-GMP-specific phosphodiesterase class I)
MFDRFTSILKSLKQSGQCDTLLLVLIITVLSSLTHIFGIGFIIPGYTQDVRLETLSFFLTDLAIILVVFGIYTFKKHRDLARERRISLTDADIISAVMEDRLEIVLQPVYRIQSGTIAGFETLVRMRHPVYGMIRPDQLMPVIAASDPEVARRMTRFIVAKTASYYHRFYAEGYDFQMSINLHPDDLADPSIITTITSTCLTEEMPFDRLTVEVSDVVLSQRPATSMKVLAGIESIEVKLALDSYGTHGSSLLNFRDFLIDEVKIASVITHRIDFNPHNVEAVRAIVHTAHSTGTYVTAKCIETPEELKRVKEAGVDYVQGYIVAPPMTIDQARVWLKTQRTKPIN